MKYSASLPMSRSGKGGGWARKYQWIATESGGAIDRGELLVRRHDVEDGEADYALGMVQRQPIGHASAPIVAGDGEALKAEHRHHLDHVHCHSSLGVHHGDRRHSAAGYWHRSRACRWPPP